MSVLIKGMNFPEKGGLVYIRNKNGKLCADAFFDGGDLPQRELDVEEVLTPHSRLVDADRIVTNADSDCKLDFFNYLINTLKNVPTVVEEEK